MAVGSRPVACFALSLLLLSACGRANSGNRGGEGNSPTGPSGTSTVAIRISILCFSPACSGGFPEVTFTFRDEVRSTTINQRFDIVGVPVGVHEITGRFSGRVPGNITVTLERPSTDLTRSQRCPGSNQFGCGGVLPGSLASVEGSVNQIYQGPPPPSCSFRYDSPDAGTFRVRFTADASVMPSC